MDPTFEVFVRYSDRVDRFAVTTELLKEWESSPREKLFKFGRSGPGKRILPADLHSLLQFKGSDDAQLNLRTSRGRSNLDLVQLYFSNPEVSLGQPANNCAISFFHQRIRHEVVGYRFLDLVGLLATLVSFPETVSGVVRLSSLVGTSYWELQKKIARQGRDTGWPLPISWITFLPQNAVARIGCENRLLEAGFVLEKRENMEGIIVATSEHPPTNVDSHSTDLLSKMTRLGITG